MKNRLIDSFKIVKRKSVKPNYSRSTKKIRIDKSSLAKTKKKHARALSLMVSLICLTLLGVLFSQTRYYNIARLALQMRNKTFLIGFQNSGELRPTGGFWGSFAVLKAGETLSESELLFETNPYKKDNILLKESSVELPTPMAQTWTDRPQSFVNANWSFNFPSAAKTLEWYFAQGWDQNVDGVFGVSSLTVIDLLKLTGPISLPDGTVINDENFTEIMSKKIDEEYWQDPKNIEINEPKTLIKDLSPRLIEATSKVSKIKLATFLFSEIRQGHISLFYNDTDSQKISENLGVSGETKGYNSDYLSVINANLNGGKTSLSVQQSVIYSVDLVNGQVQGELEVSRSHLDGHWPDILNRNWTRVVTPLGSELISADLDGNDITEDVEVKDEEGRTTFGFWLSTEPGETKTARIIYKLPISSLENYSLIYQKQAGTITEQLSISKLGEKVFAGEFNENYRKF